MKTYKSNSALAFIIALFLIIALNSGVSAEPIVNDDPLVTLSYINEILKPEIINEIFERLGSNPEGQTSRGFEDVTVQAGKVIKLMPSSEFIYRGGNAVVLSFAALEGFGLREIATGKEYFSGDFLTPGFVYTFGKADYEVYILITDSSSYFTLRGEYEIYNK